MNIEIAPTVIYANMMGMTVFALLCAVFKPTHRQSQSLVALLVLLLVHILGELYIYTGAYIYLPALAGLQFPVRVLLGPALYFYAVASMSPNNRFSKKEYAIAALGPVLVLIAMAPFVFGLTSAEKLALANPQTRDPENYKLALFACTSTMLIFIVFTFSYLAAALKVHDKHRTQLMTRFAKLEGRSLDWLKVMLILWGCTWLMYSVQYLLNFLGWTWFGKSFVFPLIESCVLMAFAYLALNQQILKEDEKAAPEPATTESDAQEPVRSASLELDTMKSIATKLSYAMKQQQLFLEDDLSLNRLSKAISISENYISETLSQHLKTNFFHYINQFRIEEAKERLLTSDSLVSTIAYDVGFNSKSTFNTAFKKSTNLTPTAFRKLHSS